MVFITRDTTGQIVWLETGNPATGLQHIISRHADDFSKKHGVDASNLTTHLQTVFRSGKVEYSRVVRDNGGYERLYSYNGKYYLLSGVGNNGYITSAYPVNENLAKKLIERYGK